MDKIQEQFKQIYGQLRDLYMSMTPGNRITATLLFLVLLASLGYLIVGSIKPADPQAKYVYLFDGYRFNPEDKVAVDSALSKVGMKDYEWSGEQLRVPRGSAASYMAQISKEKAIRLPGNLALTTAQNLSPWDSNLSKDAKMFQAKAKDVADSIASLDGIASATVLPNKRKDWDRNVWARKEIVSIAVNVTPIGYKPLSPGTVAAIGGLVSASFGTDPKLVQIVDTQNNRIYGGSGDEIGGATNYSRAQSMEEEKWKNKIHELLHIPGLQVATTVILSSEMADFLKIQQEKPKAPIHEHIRGTDYESRAGSRGGRPGHIAMMNRPLIDPQVFNAEGAFVKDKTHEEEKTNPMVGEEIRGKKLPFIPERVFASLRIPTDYVRLNWISKNRTPDETNPEPTPEELEEEKQLIYSETRKAVGKLLEDYRNPKSPDPLDSVMVVFYEPMQEEATVELTAWQKIQLWLTNNWQTLCLLGLVLCGMFVLWTISRPAKPEPIVIYEAPEIPLEALEAQAKAKAEAEAAETEEEDEELSRTLDGFDKSIRSLQDEIAELVEENPDAAAAVLRQWIGTVVPAESK